jgi:integrase
LCISDRNPFDGFSKKPKRPKNPFKRFTDEQAQLVFSRDLYQPTTLEKFWIPIVLFVTGARLTEISQLHLNDVQADPIPHIVLENLEDEDPAAAKKLKNESSHRTVPLHSKLLDIGFLDHVAAMRSAGHLHVFPNLPQEKVDGVGDLVSRDFINRFRSYGESHPTSSLNTKSLWPAAGFVATEIRCL